MICRVKLFSFLLLALPLALASCKGQEVKVKAEKVRPAKLHKVETGLSTRLLSFPAVIQAEKSSELTFQVSGQVTSLRVLEAQAVKKGQIIATVEERDYQNTVTQAQVEYQNAETEYQRAKRLYDQDAISRSILEQRDASRKVAQAALDSAQKTRGDTVLRAPFDGAISRVLVEQYQNIQAKEPIAILQSQGVEAIVSVPADLVALSKQFDSKGAYVILDAAPFKKLQAEFKEASGLADSTTQTFQASFSFEAPEELLILPGMTASLHMDFDFAQASNILPTGISVPLAAIISNNGQQYVWKVDPETMIISKQSVSAGQGMDGDLVTVVGGLKDGDLIIAAGGSFLSEGAKVKAWTP